MSDGVLLDEKENLLISLVVNMFSAWGWFPNCLDEIDTATMKTVKVLELPFSDVNTFTLPFVNIILHGERGNYIKATVSYIRDGDIGFVHFKYVGGEWVDD